MDKKWKRRLEEYVNDDFYWYQPKGFTVSTRNLPEIKKKLAILRRFEGSVWGKVQSKYTDALKRAGLFQPRSARRGGRDYAAIARMNKEIFDSLGLAWMRNDSVVVITDAGKSVLATPDGELPELVEQQLKRYHYPNPAVGRPRPSAGLFPYAAILAILDHFSDQGVPSECYELFIARMPTNGQTDIDNVVKSIRDYVKLSSRARGEFVSQLERMPLVRGGRITAPSRRTSIYRTISLNKSYMLGFLKTPGVLIEAEGQLRIEKDRRADAAALVQSHFRDECYIEFESVEDWIAFYGQTEKRPTFEEAIAYYMRRGAIERSSKLFRSAKAKRVLPSEFQKLDEGEFRRLQVLEKTLEDFLEFNLGLIETGLRFVQRQYPTPTGPLDILARDRKSRWVVIELKRGRGGDRIVGQLMRYRGFIIQEKAKGDAKRVRSLAVVPTADKRLVAAARGAAPVLLEVFEFVVKGRSRRVYPKVGSKRRARR